MPQDGPDYDLRNPVEDEAAEPPRRNPRTRAWAIGAAIGASAVVAAYFWFGRGDQPAVSTAQEAPGATGAPQEPPQQPLGGDPYAIDVPPLDTSDALVRELVKQISAHPRIAALLATDNLIRNFTAAVANVADGKSPRTQLAVLRPSSNMRIVERDGSAYIDPKSYERYNTVAEAVASLDPLDTARLYATLRPRIEEAYRELGLPDTPFDRTLERAILRLLETPVVKDPVRLQPLEEGIGYGFADPRLQSLTDAQRQLLRMGSRNVLIVQGALREIAVALGIAPTRVLGAASAGSR